MYLMNKDYHYAYFGHSESNSNTTVSSKRVFAKEHIRKKTHNVSTEDDIA